MADKPELQEVKVEAEHITVRVGILTIETTATGPDSLAIGWGTRILFDGQPPPFDVAKIELSTDAESPWQVKLTGFVREPKAETPAASWRERKPQL